MKKRIVALALSAVMSLSLAACGAPADPGNSGNDGTKGTTENQGGDTADGEKVLNFGVQSAPSGLFVYQYNQDQYNAYIVYAVYEGLTQANEEGQVEPVLAREWEVSEDGCTYTFHLAEGVKWHDGEPFSANDVAFTYTWMCDPDYNGYYSQFVDHILGAKEYRAGEADTIEGIKVIDDNTIEITTDGVYTSTLSRVGNIGIMAEHVWKDVDIKTADKSDLLRNPVGTGPFKLKEHKADQYTSLEKNPDYWQGEPKIDVINFVVVNDDTVEAQLANGEIDYYVMLSVTQDAVDMYEASGLEVTTHVANSYQCMQVNELNPLLAAPEIRLALTTAIDRQGIVDSLLNGYGNVAHTIYAESYWANPGADKLTVCDYDPEKAVEMFEAQGWKFEGTVGEDSAVMYTPDGAKAEFNMICPIGNKVREKSAVVIQSNLKDIGITLNVDTIEFATVIATMQAVIDGEGDPADFDFSLTGYGMGADPDISMLVSTGGAVNYGSYSDEQADALLTDALTNPDPDKSNEAYANLAIRISETLPAVYLYNMLDGDVRGPRVKNLINNVYWTCYNCWQWEVE